MSARADVFQGPEKDERATVEMLRACVPTESLGKRLVRTIPALRDGRFRLRALHLEQFPWKGPWAIEGTVEMEPTGKATDDGAWTQRYALRVEPCPGGSSAVEKDEPFAGHDPELALDLRLSPADPKLSQLSRALAGEIRPDGETLSNLRLLGHRFGRRAAVLGRTARGELVLLKLFSRRRADRVARTMRSLADAHGPSHRTDRFRTPDVLWCAEDRRSLLLEFLPGEMLRDRWNRTTPSDLEEIGRMVNRLATRGQPQGERWTTDSEVATIHRFLDRLRVVDPLLADSVNHRLDSVPCGLADDPPPVRIHRDLHDGQILMGEQSLGVIDWDLAATGPVEIDAGNFTAHLRLRSLQGGIDPALVSPAREAFLRGVGCDTSPGSPLETWERLATLRLAAVYGLRFVNPAIPRHLALAANRTEGLS